MVTTGIDNKTLTLYPSPTGTGPLLLQNGAEGNGLSQGLNCHLLCIEGMDWERELTPWPEKNAFRGAPYGGEAQAYLGFILKEALPWARAQLGGDSPGAYILGYSLAGLFALYALYESDAFLGGGSVSGSVWYGDFLEYCEARKPHAPKGVYLSLGDKEKNTRNPVLCQVETCTLRLRDTLKGQGVPVIFESNPGNHFFEPEKRCHKAARWLLQQDASL